MARILFLLMLLPLFSGPGWAQDDIQSVGAVWSDFVASLRRGDYRNAHSLFSPESRAVMPYEEFAGEYGPLSAAREMVLAKPESQSTKVDGDWAEITYGGTNPGTGRKFRVGAALVRNRESWGLVAARSETREKAEAAARGLLRMIWEARDRGPLRDLVAALNAAQAKNPVLRYYRVETDGTAVRAFPLEKGLRTFSLDGSGVVRAMGEGEAEHGVLPARALRVPEKSALPEQAGEKRAAPAGEDGMPELAEPRPRSAGRRGASGPDGEIAEPPMPEGRGARARPNVSLPDSIR